MIPIARPQESDELRQARRKRLAAAHLAIRAGTKVEFEDYQSVRSALYEAQGRKCAYCERQQGLEGQPVEHIRPKGGVDGGDRRRYYWLAWTWSNLLFSCVTCNCKPLKGHKFPLVAGSSPLPLPTDAELLVCEGPAFQPNTEEPLLLDPSRENPMDHIRWQPLSLDVPPDDLLWRPMPVTARGDETIKVLQLKGGLSDHVGNHITCHVCPDIRAIRCLMAQGDRHHVQQRWADMLKKLFHPFQPYQAAAHDAIHFFVPAEERAAWGLALPRPGKDPTSWTPSEIADPPALARMSDLIRLTVRAAKDTNPNLIALLCQQCSWTEADLATALELTEATVRDHCGELAAAGRLVRSSTGWSTPQPADTGDT